MPTELAPAARRRRGLAALGVIVAAFAACGEPTAHYGPAADTRAMTAIASAWSEPDGLSLALCEDVATAETWTEPHCQVDHAVRGGDLGREHSETHGGGCGGCPFANVAFVRGTVAGAGLPAPLEVAGEVRLGGARDDDPYAYPYGLYLRCVDAASPCAVIGTLDGDGRVTATLTLGRPGPRVPEKHHVLARSGPAACP
jgi:hypothetical protein